MSTLPHIHLTSISAEGSFIDSIQCCQQGLEANGYLVSTEHGILKPDSLNILFGSQMTCWTDISSRINRVIIYNWEPLAADIGRFPMTYIRQMQKAHTWDYSESNVEQLKSFGVQDIHYLPMGYVESMSCIDSNEVQDIDVLFYGEINERRQKVLDQIRAKGLSVLTSNDVGFMSRQVRDQYVSRSKVVLNMHFFEHVHLFETARVAYLLSNHKAVVAEVSEKTIIDADMRLAVVSGHLDELAQLCFDLVQDNERRRNVEEKAFEIISQRQSREIMKTAMDRYLNQFAQEPAVIGNQAGYTVDIPETLQIGAGQQWRFDCYNVLNHADFFPDLVLDISQPLPFGKVLESWRFGEVALSRQSFKKITAHYVFQNVSDLQMALSNCLSLLQEGGLLELSVPMDKSNAEWSSVADLRAFNNQTWHEIMENWCQYGWTDARFEIQQISFQPDADYGMKVLAQNNGDWGELMRVPKAMNTIYVTLQKRTLTENECKQLPFYRFMQ